VPMVHSGLGDCALANTWINRHLSGNAKRASLDEARRQYMNALTGDMPSWGALKDNRNIATAILRIIDTHIAEGDYRSALTAYKRGRRQFREIWPELSYAQRES